MFKDRKFLAGIVLGGLIGASVTLLQPMNAAAPAAGADATLQKISAALLVIGKEQREIKTELQSIKNSATSIDRGIAKIADSQTFNNPPPNQGR
ncbi:MAG: hypothetical protein ACO1RX_09345 [Candidatus Sericytochromatia bacterium]